MSTPTNVVDLATRRSELRKKDERHQCPHCRTIYLGPVEECDWCLIQTEPVISATEFLTP